MIQHPCPECWVIDFDITQQVIVGSELTLPDGKRYKITAIHGVKFEQVRMRILLHADVVGGFISDEDAKGVLEAIKKTLIQ